MDGPLAGVVELKEMYKEIYLGKIDLLYIHYFLKLFVYKQSWFETPNFLKCTV